MIEEHATSVDPRARVSATWLLLATWAAMSLVIVISRVPDYLVLVPTVVAAVLSWTRQPQKLWWMYASLAALLLLVLLAFSGLFSWAG